MSEDVFPVVLGICFDGEANWIGRSPENARRPSYISQGTFEAREGLPPLLDLLDAHGIRATFFVPGLACDRFPESVALIAARGHELGSHGYAHIPPSTLSVDEERSELVRGLDSLARISGARSTLWRAPSWDWSESTLDLLLEHGVTVSANFFDRLRPYRHERDGKPLPLVELPVQWHLADFSYFSFGQGSTKAIAPAAQAQAVWEEEFTGLYDWPGAFYHLTLHVQLIAHPGRLAMLDRHLRFVAGHRRVRFMTCGEVAATVP